MIYKNIFMIQNSLTKYLMASNTLYLSGKYNGSNVIGKGVSYPHTLLTGASSLVKHFSDIFEAISEPNPEVIYILYILIDKYYWSFMSDDASACLVHRVN